MELIYFAQIFLLLYLIERVSVIRNRYKPAIEFNRPSKYVLGYWALYIYCQEKNGSKYLRDGGRRLIFFKWGAQKHKRMQRKHSGGYINHENE